MRRSPENSGIGRCGGCASLCRFARRKVTHRLSAGAKDLGFWRRLTVTRQQSLTAMQAAARKVKGAVPQPDRDLPGNFRCRGMLTRALAQRKDMLSVKYDLCRSDLRAGVCGGIHR
ncbi:hypothetical protein HV346_14465 [Enterobacter sp. RHBSTW-00994]|uniref:hypothetical protein n=1 Tax=Enterobacter sp. RHBSTW-00994 TaxID=2742676 RepID=UPI0015E9F493|nr:hypothetical protein [Enterobacter sp. RHBSTW-00994]QLR43801.1 hypothetical protein HV346_14465 [Enterobacter sp. RHBSTW-00994]